MKKNYQEPDFEVVTLTLHDVILASGDAENLGYQNNDFDPDADPLDLEWP